MSGKPTDPIIFGFDIGIASVGWCVLGEKHIIDLGVRCFDKAETAKKGESLNLARRTTRLMRRRLRRRAWRLSKLARLLKKEGLIGSVEAIHQPLAPRKMPGEDKPRVETAWELRVRGLDEKLAPEEWAHVLYHLCKHRGFHWVSRAEEKKAEEDKGEEGGKVKQGLSNTERLMTEKEYRSTAEMVLKKFPGAQRNKRGEYNKALSRVRLADELSLLFKRQREYGNPHATPDLEIRIAGSDDRKSGLFWKQKPALSGKKLLDMLGRCTFERSGGKDGKGEYRAPKASFTAERHVWLTKLNNMKIVVDGVVRRLTPEEIKIALPLPYKYDTDLKYRQFYSFFVEKGLLPLSFTFSGLSSNKKDKKDPLEKTLIGIPAWQKLRKTLQKKLQTEWKSMAGAATDGNPEQLDQIAWVLSVYKNRDEVECKLSKLGLPGGKKMVDALSTISFDKFHNLSLVALRKIVPHMETGLHHDEACKKVGYSPRKNEGDGEIYLPPLYEHARSNKPGEEGKMLFSEQIEKDIIGGVPRNPVVLRAINQARKVLNALVRRYGSPSAVHIEMARDLTRPLKERKAISDAQKEFHDENEKAKACFEATFKRPAKNRELEKYLLYREQHGQCAYCQQPLAPNGVVHKIFEDSETETDHILPYRRSFDNSKNNKVLVHNKCNQDKADRTPYEYLTSFEGGENGIRWIKFNAWVESNHYRLAKKTRLLRKDFTGKTAEEFRERNLNDTRYICRFFKNYVEFYLKKRCVAVNGGLTSLLRARWGLPSSKEKRKENDRHHAMDAAVIAACGRLVVQRTSTMLNAEGWTHKPDKGGYLNTETGEFLATQDFVRRDEVYKLLPRPWPHFREELLLRLDTDDPALLKSKAEHYGYPPEILENLRPLFVSRAPQRRNGGAAHMDTIYAKPRLAHNLMVEVKTKQGKSRRKATPQELEGMVIERIGVFDMTGQGATKKYRLTLDRLEDIVGLERNERMVHALRLWLDERGDDPKKPGTATLPRKPQKSDSENGPFTGPEIKAVKLNGGKQSGFDVRGGVVQDERLIRLDVFQKNKRYFLVPLYVRHRVAKELPIHTADGGIAVDESYEFLFSISRNDLIEVGNGDGSTIQGYFRGYGGPPNPSNITLALHDRNSVGHPRANAKGEIPSIGVRTASSLKKFHVDTLGNIYPAPPEERRGLA